jgi:hypothetical protein
MDVIGFLCVPIGSSKVQLHESLVADAHEHVHRPVSVVKMVTMLEECTTKEQRAVVRFSRAKGRLNANDIHKELFPVYGEKHLSGTAVLSWVEKLSQGRSKVADDDRPGRLVEIEIYRLSGLFTDSLLYIRINKEIHKSTSLAVSMQ